MKYALLLVLFLPALTPTLSQADAATPHLHSLAGRGGRKLHSPSSIPHFLTSPTQRPDFCAGLRDPAGTGVVVQQAGVEFGGFGWVAQGLFG